MNPLRAHCSAIKLSPALHCFRELVLDQFLAIAANLSLPVFTLRGPCKAKMKNVLRAQVLILFEYSGLLGRVAVRDFLLSISRDQRHA